MSHLTVQEVIERINETGPPVLAQREMEKRRSPLV
jgi:hypothetical protein